MVGEMVGGSRWDHDDISLLTALRYAFSSVYRFPFLIFLEASTLDHGRSLYISRTGTAISYLSFSLA